MFTRTMSLLAVCAFAAFAQNGPGASRFCSTASLVGSYGFTAQGFTLAGSPVPAPLQGPFASLGIAVYDGVGGVALTATATFNGVSQELPTVKGNYRVNPDCTFTSRLENGATFFASIVQDGDELYVLQTNPGVVASGVAVRQTALRGNAGGSGSRDCRSAITRSVYGFISQGTSAPPTVPPPAAGPIAGVGTVSFATDGSFQLTAVRSLNGIVDPEPLQLTGKYSFNESCNFKMAFDGVGFRFNGTVLDAGRALTFLETDPGTTFVVHAKRM